MNLHRLRDRFFKQGWPTPLGWILIASFIVIYLMLKHVASERRKSAVLTQKEIESQAIAIPSGATSDSNPQLHEIPLPKSITPPPVTKTKSVEIRKINYSAPSFSNVQINSKAISESFLPKGTILYTTLTSDIVSNNQVSPATTTVVQPVIFAHHLVLPVGTRLTGKISPGNLRGRVFVQWDTLVFQDEGRQGWELPIKGIGMTYEQNTVSGRWTINGAGLKGFIFDDTTGTAFKLASLRAMEDFAKSLQTYVTSQNTTLSQGSVLSSTTTIPEATLRNSGLAFTSSFIDVIAKRYEAQLSQQNSYVLVPTARFCAVFLDEAIDLETAAPGRSIH